MTMASDKMAGAHLFQIDQDKSVVLISPRRRHRGSWRSWVNAEYGLADPDDPGRAQDVSLPHHLAKLCAASTRQGEAYKEDVREVITTFVRREVDAGRIKDRDGVVAFLENMGLILPRTGADYITVIDPETLGRIRLKGGLYSREHFDPGKHGVGITYGIPDPQRAAQLYAKTQRLSEGRARYNRGRYPASRIGNPNPGEALQAYLRRQLGSEAITPQDDGGMPARSQQRRARRRKMQETAARIEKIGPYDTVPDDRWWDDFYGEDIEP